jgi:ubiquinol-cytochrome c reductase iron-sulfur subunit
MRTGKNLPNLLALESINALIYRLWNEENKDYEIKRAQIYMLQGFVISSYVLGVKTIITCLYQ